MKPFRLEAIWNIKNKLILFCFLVTSCTFNVSAQYQPIIANDSIQWQLKHEVYDHAFIEMLSLSDTVTIDSTIYTKVNLVSSLIGYLREDTISGKAWFWGVNDSAEYLIMNLSLSVGDTFYVKMNYYPGPSNAIVTNIDTIDGRKIVELNYHYGGGFISEELKFIEGVGPNASLFYQINDDMPIWEATGRQYLFGYLVCMEFHYSSIVYAWDTVDFSCGQNVGINDLDKGQHIIEVFPNPSTAMVNFLPDPNNHHVKNVAIYDLIGRLLTEVRLDHSRLQVDLGVYGRSVYIYKASDGRSTTIGRIIIE